MAVAVRAYVRFRFELTAIAHRLTIGDVVCTIHTNFRTAPNEV
jgi:hypothetical protein